MQCTNYTTNLVEASLREKKSKKGKKTYCLAWSTKLTKKLIENKKWYKSRSKLLQNDDKKLVNKI